VIGSVQENVQGERGVGMSEGNVHRECLMVSVQGECLSGMCPGRMSERNV